MSVIELCHNFKWVYFSLLEVFKSTFGSLPGEDALAKGKVFSKWVEIVVHHVNEARLEKSGLKLFEHNL